MQSVVVMIVPLQFSKKNSNIAINAIVILKMINAFKTTLIGKCGQNTSSVNIVTCCAVCHVKKV